MIPFHASRKDDIMIERPIRLIKSHYKIMVRGNFIGAAIVAIIYTVFILVKPLESRPQEAILLVVLNALTIVLLAFAFK